MRRRCFFSASLFLLLLRDVTPGPACRISEFPCRNGRCVRLNAYCDGVDDCGDISDEPQFCTGVPCKSHDIISVGPKKYKFVKKMLPSLKIFYNFQIRSDDIWLFGFPRSGTTLMQELVWLLANDLNYEKALKSDLAVRFPYFELSAQLEASGITLPRATPGDSHDERTQQLMDYWAKGSWNYLESLKERRFIKSHYPPSLSPPKLWDKNGSAKIIYLARSPKALSISNFHFRNSWSRVDCTFEEFWQQFKNGTLQGNAYFDVLKEGWEVRNHKNVLFLFYEDFTRDMGRTIRTVAQFLGTELQVEQIEGLREHLDIGNFRENAAVNKASLKDLGMLKEGTQFIGKGRSGRWEEYFNAELEADADRWIEENLEGSGINLPDEVSNKN